MVKALSMLISQFLAIQENHPGDVKKIMAYTNSHALKELVDRQMSDYQRDYPDRVFTFDLILNPIFMDGVVAAASFDEKRGMLKGHIEINILTVLNMLLGRGWS